MSDENLPAEAKRQTLSNFLDTVRARTPARILVGRAGPSYRTATQLELRQDHAAAVDAVSSDLCLDAAVVRQWDLFEVTSQARSKHEYLVRPDLGRKLSEAGRETLRQECSRNTDFQIVIGDGLSAAAVHAQVPTLLPMLVDGARKRDWTLGRPFVVRYCRVGILNDIGEELKPEVVVLLIGERPGLATVESLSAYMAYRPQLGHTDAQRNLISNIHSRGIPPAKAAERILALAAKLKQARASGVTVKEDVPSESVPEA